MDFFSGGGGREGGDRESGDRESGDREGGDREGGVRRSGGGRGEEEREGGSNPLRWLVRSFRQACVEALARATTIKKQP